MDGKYWFKIAVGIALVFGVGMLFVQGGRKLVAGGRAVFEGSGPVTVPLLGMGFRFDGNRIGGIQHLKLLRSAPKRIDSAVVEVKLDEGIPSPPWGSCLLMLEDLEHINSHSTFRCATGDDSMRLALVPFGHLVLIPGDQDVTLWIPGKAATELRGRGLAEANLGDTGDVDVHSSGGQLSVKVNGREVVSIQGDSNGGYLRVQDEKGKPIVELRGSTTGH